MKAVDRASESRRALETISAWVDMAREPGSGREALNFVENRSVTLLDEATRARERASREPVSRRPTSDRRGARGRPF